MTNPGRPLHPALTHAPLGGVLAAGAFDIVSALDRGANPWGRDLYVAGTYVLRFATAMMVLALVSGLIDRSRATEGGTRPRSKANRHGLLMAGVTLACLVENVLRGQAPAARQPSAAVLVLTLSILALALVGGELGGRLTYRAGVHVR